LLAFIILAGPDYIVRVRKVAVIGQIQMIAMTTSINSQ
jgi:hypothetical protein